MVVTRLTLVVKVVAISSAYVLCGLLSDEVTPDIKHPTLSYFVYLLPVLLAIAGVACCTIIQAIEKDWIVVISANDSKWLSTTNATMSQIDLGIINMHIFKLFYEI
jgi:hypothetical protein